ncbi:aminopeptidase [Campylobacter sp. MIT 12-8780]|uniref:DUF4910 domain-containing protein n=1 Tax=Campylobacter sp. MIT 12-8780 TaxID=2202200 RepID=UPI00115DD704|nr:DUF4910 domain-containing protein [Campylobacter sp. MIT 12-8780]TQR42467.1 aminopeptidase [Campylobacter sp. MIT 12-8780]
MLNLNANLGKQMHALASRLFPLFRSITGEGFRQSLGILNENLNNALNIHSIKSGTQVFDWLVPPEYSVKEAFIITPEGKKICDFKQNNLHLLNFSTSIDKELSLDELNEHLYSLEYLPEAIPYVTSYYKKRWGFCIAHNERLKLKSGKYKVFIDAKHDENGVLNYADLLIPSSTKSKDEVLISSYLCHPSMANNELSGPIVACFLAKHLQNYAHGGGHLKYNYRFVFVPETIGSIVYLSKHLKHLQKRVKAGFVLSCMGDDEAYSLIHSPNANTLADKIALHTFKNKENFKEFSFLDRGSDERQYCSPNVNLPVVGLCRTRYGDFKEYHTSLDNLNFISAKGLFNSLETMIQLICNLEINAVYKSECFCEPNLGKRGLYPTLSLLNSPPLIANFLAFCNAQNDCIDIADKLGIKAYELRECIEKLLKHKLIKKVNS